MQCNKSYGEGPSHLAVRTSTPTQTSLTPATHIRNHADENRESADGSTSVSSLSEFTNHRSDANQSQPPRLTSSPTNLNSTFTNLCN